MSAAAPSSRTLRLSVFLLLAVAGLLYVKWYPYYGRAAIRPRRHQRGDLGVYRLHLCRLDPVDFADHHQRLWDPQ